MRHLLITLLILSSGICDGQTVKIDTAKWITDDLYSLHFNEKAKSVTFQFEEHIDDKGYRISNDTLIMVDDYSKSRKGDITLFKFLIRHADPKRLMIVPVDSNAKKITTKSSYTFDNLSYLHDADIRFTSLSFTTGYIHVDIGAEGKFHLTGAKDIRRSSGPVNGQLTRPALDSLNYLLQHSQLKKMVGWKQRRIRIHATAYRILVNCDGKQHYDIYTDDPPLNLQPLINYLLAFGGRLPAKPGEVITKKLN